MDSKLILPLVIGALVLGGGSFYGGMQYQKDKAPVFAAGAGRFAGGAGAGRGAGAGQGRAAAGFTNGEVVSKDANSLTLKLRDGGSKLVYVATSTNIGKMTAGSLADVETGNEVMVNGTANQDGSITASMVQIRPAGQMGAPGQRPGGAAGQQPPQNGQ